MGYANNHPNVLSIQKLENRMIQRTENGTGRDEMNGTSTMSTTRSRRALAAVAVSLVAVASGLLGGGAASAQTDPYTGEPPAVLPHRLERSSDVEGTRVEERDSGSLLPFTGADLTLFLVTGAAAVGTGGLLVKRTGARG